jgi:hypothetical protein
MRHAECEGLTDLFFSHECKSNCTDKKPCDRDPRVVEAKALCSECQVIGQCRFWSIVTALPSGIAGGLTVKERRRIRRQLRLENFPFDDYRREDGQEG